MVDNRGMSSYLLKITLRGTPNLVWRRFVVPSFTSLSRLHEVIQDVMGWQRKHPHAFYFRKQEYLPTAGGLKGKALPEEMFSLDDLIYQSGARLKYHYDPDGDKWVHDIAVESIRYIDSEWPYPMYCLEGVRACPPENCGGATGYGELLKLLKNSEHPQHGEFVKNFGDFDPERFSVEKVNKFFKVKGPVDRSGNVILPILKRERTLNTEKIDPLQILGQRLKKKAVS